MFYHSDADNLGNHTATTDINVSSKSLNFVSGILFNSLQGLSSSGNRLTFYNLGGNSFIINSASIALPQTPALDASSNYVLVWNSSTKAVGYRTASGLGSSGTGSVSVSGSLYLDLVGAGTHVDPYIERNLVFVSSTGTTTIDSRSVVTWTQGQAGILGADGTMANQPRFVVPSGYEIELCQVNVTLGKAGTDDTTLQVCVTSDAGGTVPTPGSPASTLTLSSGVVNSQWTALHGTVLNSMKHVQTRVDVAGTNAESLSIQFWGKTTACG